LPVPILSPSLFFPGRLSKKNPWPHAFVTVTNLFLGVSSNPSLLDTPPVFRIIRCCRSPFRSFVQSCHDPDHAPARRKLKPFSRLNPPPLMKRIPPCGIRRRQVVLLPHICKISPSKCCQVSSFFGPTLLFTSLFLYSNSGCTPRQDFFTIRGDPAPFEAPSFFFINIP